MAGFSSPVSSSYLLCIFLLCGLSAAKEIIVGGRTDAWTVPSSDSQSLNQWAQKYRFRVGDTLVWNYDGGKDSVLEVTKEDYANCTTSNPIAAYKDGSTKVELDRPGPFYFVSGEKGHCDKGQKLIVVVLSPRHRYTGISPAPSPVDFEGPAVAPTSSASSFRGGLAVALGLLLWGLF